MCCMLIMKEIFTMSALQAVRKHLSPGHVYRRSDLTKYSNAVDRHLSLLQKDRTLLKLSGGLYYCPRETAFGTAPPEDVTLIEGFLKDTRFLIMTPSMYNALGVGTTQLYNKTVVYNHKRHGQFKLGNRTYGFVMKHFFPLESSQEFLLVDLVDNLGKLAEDKERVLKRVKEKAQTMDKNALKTAVLSYGSERTKKYFEPILNDVS